MATSLRRIRAKVDQNAAVIAFQRSGRVEDAAAQCGVSAATVRRVLRRHGFLLRPKLSNVSKRQLKAMRGQNLTWSVIADRIGWPLEALRRFRRAAGVGGDGYRKFNTKSIVAAYKKAGTVAGAAGIVGASPGWTRSTLLAQGVIKKTLPRKDFSVDEARRLLDSGWTIRHVGERLGVSYTRLRNHLIKNGYSYKRAKYPPICLTKSSEMFVRGHALWMVAVALRSSAEEIKRQWVRGGLDIKHLRALRAQTTRTQRRALRLRFHEKFGAKIKKPPTPVRGVAVHKRQVKVVVAAGVRFKATDYPDIEKLKILCRYLRNDFYGVKLSKAEMRPFVEKFYHDDRFCELLRKWRLSGRDRWMRPSLDHVVPMARGGQHRIANFQFMTRFENLMKSDRTQQEWVAFRRLTKTRSNLFV